MGDENDRLVKLFLKIEEDVLHIRTDQRVERGKRLVHEQDLGIRGKRTGKPDALLHAARKLGRVMVFKPAETDAVDPSLGAFLGFVFGDALNGQAVGGILRHGAVREQGEFLEHHRLLVPAEIAQVVRRHCQHIHAVDNDLALGRLDQPVDMTDQGGFSRSGQAHDHLYPALGNVDIDVTKTQDMAVLVQQLLL